MSVQSTQTSVDKDIVLTCLWDTPAYAMMDIGLMINKQNVLVIYVP